ncbi:sulfotransferase domain-containing protein [Alteraurantiacibacter palmitatis]|uniref:Sulfotransferase domain-containing protein n=1 Tax=Alteraurantiacibacter palmitatis TaxID=2054628 RepID=A0ABV7E687_9SPHN
MGNKVKVAVRMVRKVKRDLIHRVAGVPWMDVQPQDRFLFSWPRSGNTWLRHIVYHATMRGEVSGFAALENASPTIDALEFRKRLAWMKPLPGGLRFFKSHLPYSEYFLKGKVVYIVRDGRDSTISYYDYFRHIHRYQGSFDDFLTKTLAGRVRYGSWAHNAGSWVAHRGHPNLLLIRFEDMRADPVGTAAQIFAFCGLELSAEQVEAAVADSSLDKVHQTFRTFRSARKTQFSGGVNSADEADEVQPAGEKPAPRGWRNVFTPEQNRRFVAKAGPLLEQLGYDLD